MDTKILLAGLLSLSITSPGWSVPLQQIQAIQDDTDGYDYFSFTAYTAASSDLKHVYTISKVDDAINVFERQDNGELSLLTTYVGNEDTGEGVRSPEDILISPDDKHVYVKAHKPDDVTPTIYVYERDASSGLLTEIQAYQDRGITSGTKISISDDGLYIYASSTTGSLTVLARASNGSLNEQQYISEPSQINLTSSERAQTVAFSPNQEDLYLAVYLSGSIGDGAIIHYLRDTNTGQLTYQDEIIYPDNDLMNIATIGGMAISPNNDFLYAAGRDGIAELAINDDGSLQFIRTTPIDNPDSKFDRFWVPNNIELSNNGRMAYVTDVVADALIVFHRNEITGALTYRGAEVDGFDDVENLSQNDRVVISPDGSYAYVGSASGFSTFALDTDVVTNHSVTTNNDIDTFTINLSNNGPTSAHDVTFNLTLPTSVVVNQASAFSNDTDCQVNTNVVTCHRHTLDVIQEEEITLTVNNNGAETYDYSGAVDVAEADTDQSNNSFAGSTNSEGDDGGSDDDNSGSGGDTGSGESGDNGTVDAPVSDSGETDSGDESSGGSGSSGPLMVILLGLLFSVNRYRARSNDE